MIPQSRPKHKKSKFVDVVDAKLIFLSIFLCQYIYKHTNFFFLFILFSITQSMILSLIFSLTFSLSLSLFPIFSHVISSLFIFFFAFSPTFYLNAFSCSSFIENLENNLWEEVARQVICVCVCVCVRASSRWKAKLT